MIRNIKPLDEKFDFDINELYQNQDRRINEYDVIKNIVYLNDDSFIELYLLPLFDEDYYIIVIGEFNKNVNLSELKRIYIKYQNNIAILVDNEIIENGNIISVVRKYDSTLINKSKIIEMVTNQYVLNKKEIVNVETIDEGGIDRYFMKY